MYSLVLVSIFITKPTIISEHSLSAINVLSDGVFCFYYSHMHIASVSTLRIVPYFNMAAA